MVPQVHCTRKNSYILDVLLETLRYNKTVMVTHPYASFFTLAGAVSHTFPVLRRPNYEHDVTTRLMA